jgi:acyl transferase domain-containing protein/NADPH:quinone reductase-like Zn-dependent oxidoreductase/acyl carrier protein
MSGRRPNNTTIAIVGASCRFPGATGLDAFWRLLVDGVDAVTEIGDERWSTRFFHHPRAGEPGRTYSWAAGLIDGIDLFDPGFFGISPREAVEMDPQQRLLLELAWHALEDAGIPAARLAGTATGVYMGASSTDYGDLRLGDPASGDQYFVAGMTLSIIANRISHVFDLRGPSLVIDTACSSSLVALHEACEALRGGCIDAALVGGVNLLLSPYPFIGFAQAGMLSRRGRCYAFDARADGYARGEGAGMVVLKRLERAVADGDPIRAIIRGTAISASGRTMGLSLPSEAAQADLLRGVYRAAGVAPEALAFVEMHGTGTPAGDPVEAAAVGRVLGQARAKELPIGSVKTNIGHLEPASGMAGLLKAMLALQRGILPRSLYGETPNPNIPFERLNLRLAGAPEAIAAGEEICAGVNSFGFGGAIAHAILSAPPLPEPIAADTAVPPLMISARSAAALRALAQDWRETLAAAPTERVPSLFRAAARRRDHHAHRLVALGDDPGVVLGDFLAGRTSPAMASGTALREGRLAFVYSGNGAQFPGMGQAAYHASPALRDAIAEVDRILSPYLGWSVGARIAGDVDGDALRRADIAQPMLFAIEVAITRVLRGSGVAPSGFVGHSVGEIAAAWAAGALSLDAAARVVAARSRHQERTRGTGRMAALALGEAEAKALLGDLPGELEIAAINSVHRVTVAGGVEAIAMLDGEAARRGIACRVLDLDFAFHSAAMEAIRDNLFADLAGTSSAEPSGQLMSTVTGDYVAAAAALDATHWWRNVRDPVRFARAVETLVADGYRSFVEIGPNPVLLSYLREALRGARVEGRAIATLDRRAIPGDPFPAIAAQLHVAGHDMSSAGWLDGPADPRGLPLYPWQRERYWFARTVEAAAQVDPIHDHHLLGFRQNGPLPSWLNHLDTARFPFLADHRVDGTPVLPAAAIIDMALASARIQYPQAASLELRDVELLRPMAFDAAAREVRSTVQPEGDWQIASRARLADEAMMVHATARLVAASPASLLTKVAGAPKTHRVVEGAALYQQAARLGLDYGESFRTVMEVVVTPGDRATVKLAPPAKKAPDSLIDPTLLDGALQGLLALLDERGDGEAGFLPRRFGSVRAVAPWGRVPQTAELHLTRRGERTLSADIALYDAAGLPVAELVDCGFARTELSRSGTGRFLRTELVPEPLALPPAPAILDRLAEILERVAAVRHRDPARETEQALLFDALIAAICRDRRDIADAVGPVPEPMLALLRRLDDDDLPDSGELWRLMLADYPDMVPELAAAAALREGLPFDERSPVVAALHQASPSAAAGKAVIAAALDEIAASWPRDRPLRLYEFGAPRLGGRLGRSGAPVARVSEGETCDIAACIAPGADPLELGANLAPGGALLSVVPLPSPFCALALGPLPDWRAALATAGFRDIGSMPVALAPWPAEVIWGRAAVAEAGLSAAAPLSLGLFTDAAAAAFADALKAAGHDILPDETAGDAVILAVGGAGDPVAEASRLLPLLSRVAAAAAERQAPLWLVTSGAQQPGGDGGLIGGALWGFARVLRNELPGLRLRSVDVPPEMTWPERAARLAQELAAANAETEIAETEIVWTPIGRHVLRVRRGLPSVWAGPGDAIAAASERPGRLDRLVWAPAQTRSPGPCEIAIEVCAAGVNFRDVMAATGRLPEEALLGGFAGAALGLECAGVVGAIGDGVETLAVGDWVAGFAPAALASHAVTRADAVIAIPHGMSFAAAATLPVAFVTALYSLDALARLMPGESVLIHAASGGVGLAAIQIAKARGATVIASAGSAAKRAFLRLAGADHVCDSRKLRFVASVREATGGAGVDVVLNSLHGEAMAASLELVKPFGRFIELGKRDFHENRRLRLKPLRNNLAYFVVDVDQLPARRPALAKSLLGEVSALLAGGKIRPLAHRIFAFAEIADAFRLMHTAQHIGKLVLVPNGNAGAALARPASLALRRDATYVVTGGLAGFGFAAARWLAEHGARRLALIGRRGAETPGAAGRIAELTELGAIVSIHAADVADRAALKGALKAIREQNPICGVVHAAAEIVDGTAATLSPADVAANLRAKLGGALLLDDLTGDDKLDLFWLFSSATALVGAPGQGAYAAANQALEALARRRHAAAKPALAIGWGPIADAGALAERPREREALTRRLGARPLDAAKALSALPMMPASGLPVVCFADIGGSEAPALPGLTAPLFADIIGAATQAASDEALRARLAGLDGPPRRDLLAAVVAEEAARILRLPAADIDWQRPLAELGMDSLMAIELRLALEARLRHDLPLMSLGDGASVAALAARLAQLVAQPETAAVVALAERHEAPRRGTAPGGFDLAAEG